MSLSNRYRGAGHAVAGLVTVSEPAFRMSTVIPFHADLSPAAYVQLTAVIAADGVAAIPTESSYALAVSPFRDNALAALFRTKRRPDGKPILVLIGEPAQVRITEPGHDEAQNCRE